MVCAGQVWLQCEKTVTFCMIWSLKSQQPLHLGCKPEPDTAPVLEGTPLCGSQGGWYVGPHVANVLGIFQGLFWTWFLVDPGPSESNLRGSCPLSLLTDPSELHSLSPCPHRDLRSALYLVGLSLHPQWLPWRTFSSPQLSRWGRLYLFWFSAWLPACLCFWPSTTWWLVEAWSLCLECFFYLLYPFVPI